MVCFGQGTQECLCFTLPKKSTMEILIVGTLTKQEKAKFCRGFGLESQCRALLQ